MNLYKFHSNPDSLIRGEHKNRVLTNMVRDRLGYTSRFAPDLVDSIVDQLGGWKTGGESGTNLHDILVGIENHGIDYFSGFKSKDFFLKNRKEIVEFCESEGIDFGYDVAWDNEAFSDLAEQGLEEEKLGAMSMVLDLQLSRNSTAEEIYFTMYDSMGNEGDTAVCHSISVYVVEGLASEYVDIMNS